MMKDYDAVLLVRQPGGVRRATVHTHRNRSYLMPSLCPSIAPHTNTEPIDKRSRASLHSSYTNTKTATHYACQHRLCFSVSHHELLLPSFPPHPFLLPPPRRSHGVCESSCVTMGYLGVMVCAVAGRYAIADRPRRRAQRREQARGRPRSLCAFFGAPLSIHPHPKPLAPHTHTHTAHRPPPPPSSTSPPGRSSSRAPTAPSRSSSPRRAATRSSCASAGTTRARTTRTWPRRGPRPAARRARSASSRRSGTPPTRGCRRPST